MLLFVPLGFLFPLTRPGDDEPSATRASVLGLLSQRRDRNDTALRARAIQLRDRRDHQRDRRGARHARASFDDAAHSLERAARRRLSLEIPLMGLIYLLVPLLLVASLSAVMDSVRMVALIPLGLIGARLMGAVQQNHFGPSELFGRRTMGASPRDGWCSACFPVLLRHPLVGASLVGLVGVATWHESAARPAREGAERRFEAETLRSLTPYVAAYFIVIVFLPLATSIDAWHFELGLTGRGTTSINSSFVFSSRSRR